MSIVEALLLALLQGATEFLPVSSSGHLVLAQALFPAADPAESQNLLFELLVHLGTLAAICVVFRAAIVDILGYALSGVWRLMRAEGARRAWLGDPRGRMIVAVGIATVITAGLGMAIKDVFEGFYQQPRLVGVALLITACLLGATLLRRRPAEGLPDTEEEDPANGFPYPLWMAALIGLAQTMALAPGISRSGSTIAVAILLGVGRRQAGEFSFLIAIPAILGATLVELLSEASEGTLTLDPAPALVAFVFAALSGYAFLRLLLRFVRGGQFAWFGLYCLVVGVWALLYFG